MVDVLSIERLFLPTVEPIPSIDKRWEHVILNWFCFSHHHEHRKYLLFPTNEASLAKQQLPITM